MKPMKSELLKILKDAQRQAQLAKISLMHAARKDDSLEVQCLLARASKLSEELTRYIKVSQLGEEIK